MNRDLVGIVESAYRLDLDDDKWLTEVSRAVRPFLDEGLGLAAWYYDASLAGELRTFGFIGHRDARIPMAFVSHAFGVTSWRELARQEAHRQLRVDTRRIHIFNAADPGGQGCVVGAPIPAQRKSNRVAPLLWGRLAAHVAAGLRIRRKLQALARRVPSAEAVITPAGKVAHATGAARESGALLALRRAALAADKARGPMRRKAPEQAIAIWQGLVDGRWTLLDQFEKDGRRFLVATRNDPQLQSPRALTLRERQVLAYAALGHSTKLIAYELGLSVGTASAYLATGMRKLGLRSRVQLVNLGAKLAGPVPTGRR